MKVSIFSTIKISRRILCDSKLLTRCMLSLSVTVLSLTLFYMLFIYMLPGLSLIQTFLLSAALVLLLCVTLVRCFRHYLTLGLQTLSDAVKIAKVSQSQSEYLVSFLLNNTVIPVQVSISAAGTVLTKVYDFIPFPILEKCKTLALNYYEKEINQAERQSAWDSLPGRGCSEDWKTPVDGSCDALF